MKPTENRLSVVQARLDERGLCDVKISFTPRVSEMSKDQVSFLVSDLLEDYLDGKSGTLGLFGDSTRNQ